MLGLVRQALGRALCLLTLALAPVSAQAQATAGVLSAFGFFGSWAMQCGAPPSPANLVQTVGWSGREPVDFTAMAAPGGGNHYRIVTAQMPDAATLVLQVHLNGRYGETLTITRYGSDRIRTMATQTAQGPLVQGGVVLATGRPTPWLQRCR